MRYTAIAPPNKIEAGKAGLYAHNVRTYREVCSNLEDHNDICIISGTGTGKSFIFFALLEGPLSDGGKVLYIAPKECIYLNLQKYPCFGKYAERITFVSNNYFQSPEKVEWALQNFDIFILDECHHIGAEITGSYIQSILWQVKGDPTKAFIGLTATPVRDSDKVDVSSFFSAAVYGKTTMECIEEGLMPQVEYLVCKPDDSLSQEERDLYREKLSIEGSRNLLKKIITDNPRKKWLCYFGSLEDMNTAREDISTLFPDHRMLCVSSDDEGSQKEIDRIGADENVVILSVSMLLEGIHLPNMEGVLLFRNVQSVSVFQQIFGRITAIGAGTSPLFVDCTSTATRMFRKILPPGNAAFTTGAGGRMAAGRTARPILRVSLANQELFDITRLLLEMEDLRHGSFEFLGILYPSFTDAARAHGINDIGLLYRHINKHGSTKEEALAYYVEHGVPNFNFVFEGAEYPNLKAACLEYGINPVSVNVIRHKLGCSQQEALRYYLDSERRTMSTVYEGQTYPTLKAACEAAGISYKSAQVKGRELNGDHQAAFDHLVSIRGRSIYEVTLFGKKYPSIQQACETLGVNPSQVNKYRHRWKCTLEKAVSFYLDKREKDEKKTLKSRCAEIGVDYMKVCKYKSRTGCSEEEALQYVMAPRDDAGVTVDGVTYSTMKEMLDAMHISRGAYDYYRRKEGLSPEDIIHKIQGRRKQYEFQGESYPSFAEACRSYGTTPENIRSAANYHGISRDEALKRYISLKSA